jgi:amidohydrolase
MRTLILLAASVSAQEIAPLVDAMAPKLIETRRDFHMHPELSNKEARTGQVIAQKLREFGFTEVRTNVAGHGVVATLKGGKPGPVVAWRTDMDALPIDESTFNVPYHSRNAGVKHACGHDAHMTVALGVAELFAKIRKDIPGTVKFIFQPAEEGVSDAEYFGAALMIREGALENPKPQAIFAFHVSPLVDAGKIGYANGPFLASADSVDIVVKGKKAHASVPQDGIDALVSAAQCVNMLQTIHSRRISTMEPSVLTIGSINGGDRSNVVADSVRMEGTLRTFSEATREAYRTYVRQTLAGCTAIHGGAFDLNWIQPSYPVTVNPEAVVAAALPSIEKSVGKDNALRVAPQMGAEDFSLFQKEIPGAMFWLGVRNESKGISSGLHTADFDIDESSLAVGVKTAANILLDYLKRNATSASR